MTLFRVLPTLSKKDEKKKRKKEEKENENKKKDEKKKQDKKNQDEKKKQDKKNQDDKKKQDKKKNEKNKHDEKKKQDKKKKVDKKKNEKKEKNKTKKKTFIDYEYLKFYCMQSLLEICTYPINVLSTRSIVGIESKSNLYAGFGVYMTATAIVRFTSTRVQNGYIDHVVKRIFPGYSKWKWQWKYIHKYIGSRMPYFAFYSLGNIIKIQQCRPDLSVKEIIQERKPGGLQQGFGWFAAKIAVGLLFKLAFRHCQLSMSSFG